MKKIKVDGEKKAASTNRRALFIIVLFFSFVAISNAGRLFYIFYYIPEHYTIGLSLKPLIFVDIDVWLGYFRTPVGLTVTILQISILAALIFSVYKLICSFNE